MYSHRALNSLTLCFDCPFDITGLGMWWGSVRFAGGEKGGQSLDNMHWMPTLWGSLSCGLWGKAWDIDQKALPSPQETSNAVMVIFHKSFCFTHSHGDAHIYASDARKSRCSRNQTRTSPVLCYVDILPPSTLTSVPLWLRRHLSFC